MSGKPGALRLECVQVGSTAALAEELLLHGDDFWVSCLADCGAEKLPEKAQSYRVEEELVLEIFTKCIYLASADIRADSDAVLQQTGVGLRRGVVRSKNVAGCVFAFVNEYGPTVISQRRAALPAENRSLPGEERLRRTSLSFATVNMQQLLAEAKKNLKSHYATSYSACSAEDAPKKAVITPIEGQPAAQRFKRCLIAEVADCQQATARLANQAGLGLRKQHVRSRAMPGCVALLLTTDGSAESQRPQHPVPALPAAPVAARSAPPAMPALEMNGTLARFMSPKPTAVPAPAVQAPPLPVLFSTPSKRPAAGWDQGQEGATPPKRRREAGEGARGAEDTEELYYRQVRALEMRLGELLPTLPRAQLTTDFVQSRLEDQMKKPQGRLEKFRRDIARIWRAYAEGTARSVPDLD